MNMDKEVEYDSDEQVEIDRIKKEKEERCDDSNLVLAVQLVGEKIGQKEDQINRLRVLVESLPDMATESPNPQTPVNNVNTNVPETPDTMSPTEVAEEVPTKEGSLLQIEELSQQLETLRSVLENLNQQIHDYLTMKDETALEPPSSVHPVDPGENIQEVSRSTKKIKASKKTSTNAPDSTKKTKNKDSSK